MFADRRILIIGMARSGIAAARLLLKAGAKVTVNDIKTLDKFNGALDDIIAAGALDSLGIPPDSLVDESDMIVISPGVPMDLPFIQKARESGKEIIGELELASLFLKGMLVAVTGTNGKSTTVTLVGEIFKNAGKLSYVAGNIGLPFSDVVDGIKTEDVAVVEVSSFQLESIKSFRPHCAAVLNLREDHLNRHETMENYIAIKMRIFENQKSGDYAVLNYDDELIRANAKGFSAKKVWFSSTQKVSFGVWVEGDSIVYGSPGASRVVCAVSDVLLPGRHNLENALAATAMAAVCGVQLPVIRHTLKTFSGIEHRIETVEEIAGVRYINDSKGTNVDATIAAVKAMDRPTVILLGGYDKHTDFGPLSRVVKGSSVRAAVLLGQTKEQIKTSLQENGFDEIEMAQGFEEAVLKAKDMAVFGENVLLSPACASFDMFKDFEERGRAFKEIVCRLKESL
ncbi:MAG: UDP-N-acetylmuramoyl-L-alanine--D-glutamate ligase [Christensenellales bacterium]|jgi:UDP-N-acetylmuramoylalanine--D-glutamate ligase